MSYKNENLLPRGILIKHVINIVMIPILIALIVGIIITIGYTFGTKALSEHYNKRAIEITETSYKTKYDEAVQKVQTANEDIKNINNQIDNLERNIQILDTEVTSNVQIQEVINYVVSNKPHGLTVVMMEDAETYHLYRNDAGSQSTQDTTNTMDPNNPEQGESNAISNTPQEYRSELTYSENYGKQLIVRGFAQDMVLLADYIRTIEKSDSILSCEIIAIEEVEVTDYTINVFELMITYK